MGLCVSLAGLDKQQQERLDSDVCVREREGECVSYPGLIAVDLMSRAGSISLLGPVVPVAML